MHHQQHSRRPNSHTTVSITKRAALGNTAGMVAPAWRSNVVSPYAGYQHGGYMQNGIVPRQDPQQSIFQGVGSKIFMSQLPSDVHESEIEELFLKTVGPVFDVFVVYNSHGRSKGMAVVNFQRAGDAMEARKKFNGKFIDGSRPMKIEIISDPVEREKTLTLAERLGDPLPGAGAGAASTSNGTRTAGATVTTPRVFHAPPQGPRARPQWRNMKKGPRRLKKSAEQLDREMEAYRAEANRLQDSGTGTGAAPGAQLHSTSMPL